MKKPAQRARRTVERATMAALGLGFSVEGLLEDRVCLGKKGGMRNSWQSTSCGDAD